MVPHSSDTSCARTDAVFTSQTGGKSHVKGTSRQIESIKMIFEAYYVATSIVSYRDHENAHHENHSSD